MVWFWKDRNLPRGKYDIGDTFDFLSIDMPLVTCWVFPVTPRPNKIHLRMFVSLDVAHPFPNTIFISTVSVTDRRTRFCLAHSYTPPTTPPLTLQPDAAPNTMRKYQNFVTDGNCMWCLPTNVFSYFHLSKGSPFGMTPRQFPW